MSWHYLQEQAAAFSVDDYLAGIRSERSKSKSTRARSCSTSRSLETCHDSPSGTMSPHSMESRGADSSTLSAAVSHARTSAALERVQESREVAPGCGLKCTESFAKYDPATHSWKTPQCSLLADLDEYSETWSKSGIMLHGACWELPTAAHLTAETESGFWVRRKMLYPTPLATDAKNNGGPGQQKRHSPQLGAVVGGPPNPLFVEWLMGWPIGWTDLKHSATVRFRSWRRQHSKPLNKD